MPALDSVAVDTHSGLIEIFEPFQSPGIFPMQHHVLYLGAKFFAFIPLTPPLFSFIQGADIFFNQFSPAVLSLCLPVVHVHRSDEQFQWCDEGGGNLPLVSFQ